MNAHTKLSYFGVQVRNFTLCYCTVIFSVKHGGKMSEGNLSEGKMSEGIFSGGNLSTYCA